MTETEQLTEVTCEEFQRLLTENKIKVGARFKITRGNIDGFEEFPEETVYNVCRDGEIFADTFAYQHKDENAYTRRYFDRGSIKPRHVDGKLIEYLLNKQPEVAI